MADKFVFHGKDKRAQLAIWDLRGPGGNGELNFSVSLLPQTAHKYTAYGIRNALNVPYYGDSIIAALGVVQHSLA